MIARIPDRLSTTRHDRRRPTALLAVELFLGLNAVVGGIGLMINGLGMPLDQLDGSPFDSYLIPGLILALVVGGATLGAAGLVWTRRTIAPLASLAAGAVTVGWIAGQVAMLGSISLLQPVILGLGLLILGFTWRWTTDRRNQKGTIA